MSGYEFLIKMQSCIVDKDHWFGLFWLGLGKDKCKFFSGPSELRLSLVKWFSIQNGCEIPYEKLGG